MNCQELDSILYPYLDGEFQPEERLEVEAHLTGCADCARRVHEEARMMQSLRRAARQAVDSTRAPDTLRARVRQNIHLERRREWKASWSYVGAAAAAVLVMIGGVGMALRPEHHQRFVDDAARRHAKKLPAEISGTSHESVEAWFDGKLDHRVPVPRLSDAQLSGARISNVTDRPAAYISYERSADTQGAPARRIGLFVFNDAQRDIEAPPLPAVQVDSSHGYNVAVWREGEIVYELVTDLDETDILRMLAQQGGTVGGKPSRVVTPDVTAQPVSLQP